MDSPERLYKISKISKRGTWRLIINMNRKTSRRCDTKKLGKHASYKDQDQSQSQETSKMRKQLPLPHRKFFLLQAHTVCAMDWRMRLISSQQKNWRFVIIWLRNWLLQSSFWRQGSTAVLSEASKYSHCFWIVSWVGSDVSTISHLIWKNDSLYLFFASHCSWIELLHEYDGIKRKNNTETTDPPAMILIVGGY